MRDDDPFASDRIRERLTILEAMSTAFERRQELMDVVASAVDADVAREEVMTTFGFNRVQAHPVLDLQVRRFAQFERRLISDEMDELGRQPNAAPIRPCTSRSPASDRPGVSPAGRLVNSRAFHPSMSRAQRKLQRSLAARSGPAVSGSAIMTRSK